MRERFSPPPIPDAVLLRRCITSAVVTAACCLCFKPSEAANAPPAARPETRCGWFHNPTPGNAWLTDPTAQWIIGTQGGHQAQGDWPEFAAQEWIATNRSYGYGCACLRVVVDRKTHEVLKILSANARPVAACRNDPALARLRPEG